MAGIYRWTRAHAHPKVVIPIIVGLGLLAYVASLASAPQSSGQLWTVLRRVWWIALVLTIPYFVARLWVWNDLLRRLGITVKFRRLLLSFAGGELTKSLPAGIYVENYLLKRLRHLDEEQTVRSTVATTAMLGLETAIALAVVLAIGVPGASWVRWGLGIIVAIWVLVLACLWILVNRIGDRHPDMPDWLRHIQIDAKKFLHAGGALIRPRTLRDLPPTALYMFVYAADLFFITRALPARNLSWSALITVYAVMILAVVLIPIPTEIGISEISALGALSAFGVGHGEAAVVALALRILGTGATILVAGVIFLALRSELRVDEIGD
ncbi:MAG: lysylphosphatidylglycerol synthase transmembrane domain-containing protein, partial [Chloroflexota bacterium]